MVLNPLDYPGVPARSVGVWVGSHFRAMAPSDLPEALAAANAAPLGARSLVVAVGSNAVPATVCRKLSAAGVGTVVPFTPCRVTGLAVGHSAHVSVGGYIPAAPFACPGASTPLTASWFDAAQLQALDGTEPNYRRVRLDGARYPLSLADGTRPAGYFIYESVHGVLTAPTGAPVPLMSQAAVQRRFLPDDVTSALTDPAVRADIRGQWHSAGRTCGSGLGSRC